MWSNACFGGVSQGEVRKGRRHTRLEKRKKGRGYMLPLIETASAKLQLFICSETGDTDHIHFYIAAFPSYIQHTRTD